MTTIHWILGALGTLGLWILWEFIGSIIAEALWLLTAPFRRAIWHVLLDARWPWPLLLLGGAGAGVFSLGLLLMAQSSTNSWTGVVGVALFFAGAFLGLISPLLWRDARRVRHTR